MHTLYTKIRNITRNKIVQSSLGLLIITLGVKALGYVEKLVLAYFFGTSHEVDIYNIVITIILSLFFLFREIIEPGFLNVFLRLKANSDDVKAWNLFNKAGRLILAITLIVTILSVVFPQVLVKTFAPGFNAELNQMTTVMLQIAFPACIFLCLSTLTNITLNGEKQFVIPASGELIFKASIIAVLVVFFDKWGIYGIAVGILVGAVGKLLLHFILLRKKIHINRAPVEKKQLKSIWRLTWPLLAGVSFSQASGLIDNIFGSYLQEGAISSLSYAKKIIELPVLLFPYIISVVMFPYLSELSIEKQQKKLILLFTNSMQWIVVVFLPLACFIGLFASELVKIIFERGAFDQSSTQMTALPLSIYAIGLVFFAIETVLVIFYYSSADTKTPVFIGMACVCVNIILTYLFVRWIGYTGIALAYVVQKWLKNIILLFLLSKKITISYRSVVRFLKPVLFALAVYTVLLQIFRDQLSSHIEGGPFIQAVTLGGVFLLFAGIYILILRIMKFKINVAIQ
ncbi:Putative peptidoglycan lipid II flippase MurJ [Fulvivirga imtechensis AK7]|uniref:Lipid II flippase n=1 Tax=Fulvivirga imtechensis AK7 TaxID=1237149 RepID=L8JYL6_9BACT|nr:murein biosynthesis integral membrane protein MurJ [Fulvivirga imtechensis]ELR72287.1 Putative peptidoglycan lipid II flippase MurJ [Fulvivirga imtechensis AK7]